MSEKHSFETLSPRYFLVMPVNIYEELRMYTYLRGPYLIEYGASVKLVGKDHP